MNTLAESSKQQIYQSTGPQSTTNLKLKVDRAQSILEAKFDLHEISINKLALSMKGKKGLDQHANILNEVHQEYKKLFHSYRGTK
jgi:hypothetical protein